MRGKFLTLAGLALVVGAQPVFSQSTKLDATKTAVSLGGRMVRGNVRSTVVRPGNKKGGLVAAFSISM